MGERARRSRGLRQCGFRVMSLRAGPGLWPPGRVLWHPSIDDAEQGCGFVAEQSEGQPALELKRLGAAVVIVDGLVDRRRGPVEPALRFVGVAEAMVGHRQEEPA